MRPSLAQVFAYFRLCLVTGLVEPSAVVAWADRQILAGDGVPPHELIELSLSGSQPLSRMVGRLYDFQSKPGDETPLRMVLARAGVLLENGAAPGDLMQELRLLLAESVLPAGLRRELKAITADWELFNRAEITERDFHARLVDFLAAYRDARDWLPVLS